ncbi:MAG: ADP-heptose synthase [Woeseia sp.]|nr:ADP-heptose synthase [Woeseia sp.]
MSLQKTALNEVENILVAAGSDREIVFISGIFNTIHPGHTRLFRYAQEQGDFVVVGVLDDAMAPSAIVAAEDRLAAVDGMAYIDYAFILHDTPEDLITALQPATVVKGLEYKTHDNPEKAAVDSYGGRLIFSSGETLFSSLDLLRRDLLQVDHSTIHSSDEFLRQHGITSKSLDDRLRAMQEKRVMVIGDTVMDEYITCDPVGLSREDPTVVVRPLSSDTFLGGAGIVSAHARSLGRHVDFFTVLGRDGQGNRALELLVDYGIEVTALRDDTRPTTHKKRYRAQDRTMLRVNTFSEIEISESLQSMLFDAMMEKIHLADLVIFSDFNYGILPQPLVDRITECARAQGALIVADSQTSSQSGDISRFSNMSLITPTEHEARVALRDTTGGLAQVANALINKSGCKELIVTLGAQGIFMQSRGRDKDRWQTDRLPAFNSLPRDPAGAGDAMMVAAGLGLTSGAPLWEAAYLGSIAAACQVSRLGNLPLTIEELAIEVARGGMAAL